MIAPERVVILLVETEIHHRIISERAYHKLEYINICRVGLSSFVKQGKDK